MSSADILEDSFPHGTPAGYRAGCNSGGLCTNKGTERMTCKEANTRYAADRRYRTLIDAGVAWIVPGDVTPEALAAATATGKPKPAKRAAAAKPAAEIPDEVRAKLAAPDFPHGTTRGYSRGCKGAAKHLCTGDTDGRTCAQAWSEYLSDRKAKAALDEATKTATAAAVSPTDVDAVPEGAIALGQAGTAAVDAVSSFASGFATGIDLTDYAATDAPDLTVDGVLEQNANLEAENARLTELTGDQTATIIALRSRIAELERIAAADREAAAAAESDIQGLNAELAQLRHHADELGDEITARFAEQERAVEAFTARYEDEQADPRVRLALTPVAAATVILALAGGER